MLIKKISIFTLAFHLFVILLVGGLYSFDRLDDLEFAIIVAILLPILVVYIDVVITFYTKDSEWISKETDENNKGTPSILLTMLSVFYALGTIFLLVKQVLKPMSMTSFIALFGLLESLAGIFLMRLFKTMFK